MAIENRWLISGKIIYCQLIGDLTIDEIHDASQTFIGMFDESEYDNIHLIVDETQVGKIPISLKLVSNATEFMKHPKLGWFFMYPAIDEFAKFFANILSGIAGVSYHQSSTLEYCLKSLTGIDSSLPTLEELIALSDAATSKHS